ERLVSALTAARTQLVELRAQLEEMTRPPGSYAVFVRAHKDRSIDVMSSGRKLRVGVAPSVEADELPPVPEVQLNEAMTAVAAGAYEPVGELVTVKEVLDEDRVLAVGRADEERVLRLAGPLAQTGVRVGDALTVDTRTGFTFERI